MALTIQHKIIDLQSVRQICTLRFWLDFRAIHIQSPAIPGEWLFCLRFLVLTYNG